MAKKKHEDKTLDDFHKDIMDATDALLFALITYRGEEIRVRRIEGSLTEERTPREDGEIIFDLVEKVADWQKRRHGDETPKRKAPRKRKTGPKRKVGKPQKKTK